MRLNSQADTDLAAYRDEQMGAAKSKLISLIDNAYGTITFQAGRVKSGVVGEAEGKELALQTISAMRYDKGQGYYWIHSFNRERPDEITMLMHPTNASSVGKDASHLKYSEGDRSGKDVSATVMSSGNDIVPVNEPVPFMIQLNRLMAAQCEGIVGYEWTKPNMTGYYAKWSYGRLYEPWGIVVATGFYVDDIEANVAAQHNRIKDSVSSNMTIVVSVTVVATTGSIVAMFFIMAWLRRRLHGVASRLASVEGDLTSTEAANRLLNQTTNTRSTITVGTDTTKCVNCFQCIAACPVPYCNNASGEAVLIDQELCINCGECIRACTHGARYGIDDTDKFVRDIKSGVNMIAVVEPAIAANFPGKTKHFVGWLKSLGVRAVYDASFGAELVAHSYAEHINAKQPKTLIAQACPSVVTYIELNKPELLQYLAPSHSPTLSTIKMVREFFSDHSRFPVAVFSPCLARRREFDDTGLGDYNVTFGLLKEYFTRNSINLSDFPEVEFDGPVGERAVIFGTPGGLLQTMERTEPNLRSSGRAIGGSKNIYQYLNDLSASISKGHAPVVVDCLNCSKGCNAGSGTDTQMVPVEDLESEVHERRAQMEAVHKKGGLFSKTRTELHLASLINNKWMPGLYDRKYTDRSKNNNIMVPSPAEFSDIYRQMGMQTESDRLNCGACGYGRCEQMAVAIYNGLNKVENCYFYRERMIKHLSAQGQRGMPLSNR